MRKKDKEIKEAFKIYQTNKESVLDDYEIETEEGFEDKIYQHIAKLNIPNPRAKAHRIWLGIVVAFIVVMCVAFALYYQNHKAVDVTKTMEQLYSEGYFATKEYNINSEYGYINPALASNQSDQDTIRYTIRYLRDTQLQDLEKSNIAYKRTGVVLWQMENEFAGNTTLISNTHEPIKKKWTAFQLSDRKSCYYYILEDTDGNMAIARYASFESAEENAKGKNICTKIFGIDTEESVRSITLERYCARNKENEDKILSIYTSSAEKKEILDRFKNADLRNKTNWDNINGLKENEKSTVDLTKDTWQQITKKTPQDCYYLTIENNVEEKWILKIVNTKEDFVIFADTVDERQMKQVQLKEVDEMWFQEIIEKADKVY